MSTHKVTKTEDSKNQRDFTENTAKDRKNWDGRVARGAGFEPAELDEKADGT